MKNERIVIDRISTNTFLIEMSYLIVILALFVSFPFKINVIIELLLGLLMYMQIVKIKGKISKNLSIILLSGVLLYICSVFNGQDAKINEYLISILFYLPLANILISQEYDIRRIFKFSTILLSVLVILFLFDRNFYEILVETSRNSLSFYGVMLTCPIIFNYYKNNVDKTNDDITINNVFIMSVLVFIISVFSIGRGGILASSFFLVGTCIILLTRRRGKSTWEKIKKVLIIILMSSVIVGLVVSPDYYNLLFSRFVERQSIDILNEPRMIMINQYMQSLNYFEQIVFGFDRNLCSMIYAYGGNPHNSFILVHSNYGLIGLLFVILLFLRGIFNGLKRGKYLFSILLITIIIRSFADSFFGNGFADVIIYALFLANSGKRSHIYRTRKSNYRPEFQEM